MYTQIAFNGSWMDIFNNKNWDFIVETWLDPIDLHEMIPLNDEHWFYAVGTDGIMVFKD